MLGTGQGLSLTYLSKSFLVYGKGILYQFLEFLITFAVQHIIINFICICIFQVIPKVLQDGFMIHQMEHARLLAFLEMVEMEIGFSPDR